MCTETRVRELCAINNNIIVECNKMMQYLQIIKEKSDYAVYFLNSLSTANILRKYSATYEYLNKFYIKLLDQNCLFELFFMELNELNLDDIRSTCPSVKDLTESASMKSVTKNFIDSQKLRSTNNNEAIAFKTSTSKAESTLSREEVRSEENKYNVNAREFQPGSSSSSISYKSEISEQPAVALSITKDTPEISITENKSVNKSDKENFTEFILQSSSNSNSNSIINNGKKESKRTKKKEVEKSDMCSTSSDSSEPQKQRTQDKDLLNIEKAIKQVNDKWKENEISAPTPDLRPVVRRDPAKIIESSSSTSTPCSPNVKTTTNKAPNKKRNHSIESPTYNRIEAKIGLAPKEGDFCCISTVESPSSFYVHVIRDENTLIDILSQQIAEISHSLKSFYNKKTAKRNIDKYCFCFINTHAAWCRVEIINWMMDDENLIEVRLIDYGLKCKVPLRNIRGPIQFLFQVPIMADQCKLAWVKPTNSRDDWSKDSIQYFEGIINKHERFFQISHVSEDNGRLSIDLQNNEINSIAGLMISDGKAESEECSDNEKWSNEFMNKQIIKAQGLSEEEMALAEEDRLEAIMYDDEDDDEVSDPNLAVSHYKPRDEANICRIFLARGHCFKGKNCTFSHEPLNPDGWTTDREPVFYDAFNQLQLPPPDTEITVKIVNIVDLRTFYVVVKNLPECKELFGMPVNNIRSLVKLMNDPEEVQSLKPLIVIPALGELVLVKYEDNWHRAKVIGFEEFSYKIELEIFLVDFGKIIKLNMKHCRKIKQKHLHVPFQVVLCTLCNVCMKDNLTETECEMGNDYLEMHVENKKLRAKIMYSECYLNVHLFTDKGQDVGEELIKAGIVHRSPGSIISQEYSLLVE